MFCLMKRIKENMTEGRAFALVFFGEAILGVAGCALLAYLDAPGSAYGLLVVLVGGGAAQFTTAVIEHYGSERRRR
jgi:hypothetical protein